MLNYSISICCRFRDCTSLTSIEIPNNVKKIEGAAFSNCSSIKTISIGENVNEIEEIAFAGCKDLETVYCYAEKLPTTDQSAFRESFVNYVTLYVPEKAIEVFKSSAPWNEFGTITSIESNGIEQLHDNKLAPYISCTEGLITIQNLNDGDNVVAYSVDGKLLGSANATEGSVHLSATAGIILLKIGTETIATMVK